MPIKEPGNMPGKLNFTKCEVREVVMQTVESSSTREAIIFTLMQKNRSKNGEAGIPLSPGCMHWRQ